jgi:hypothetical protein
MKRTLKFKPSAQKHQDGIFKNSAGEHPKFQIPISTRPVPSRFGPRLFNSSKYCRTVIDFNYHAVPCRLPAVTQHTYGLRLRRVIWRCGCDCDCDGNFIVHAMQRGTKGPFTHVRPFFAVQRSAACIASHCMSRAMAAKSKFWIGHGPTQEPRSSV